MKKIKRFFKQLLCRHADAELLRWHWTHGPLGNDPAFIEAEFRCKKCGKIFYAYEYGATAYDWAEAMGTHKKA